MKKGFSLIETVIIVTVLATSTFWPGKCRKPARRPSWRGCVTLKSWNKFCDEQVWCAVSTG